MPQFQLKYGVDTELTLDMPTEARVDQCGLPTAVPLDLPEAAVAAALVQPLGHPPLSAASVPGDHIVLAVDSDVPQPSAVVAAVVKSLLEGLCEASDILILLADESLGAKTITRELPRETGLDVHVAVHDPADSSKMAYLAVAEGGQPVFMSRVVCDADLVISIRCARSESALGYLGLRSGLFPTFADEATQRRFRSPAAAMLAAGHEKHRHEAENATWLLGARFMIQIIPGDGDSIMHVLAGDVDDVVAEATRFYSAAWDCNVMIRPSLVVAAIPGPWSEQTWTNFARALSAAGRVVEEDGAIAVCSGIASRPGAAFQKVVAAASLEEADRDVRRSRTEDAIPASQLVATLETTRVYLISELDDELVEDLGIAPIGSHAELNHLCQQHSSCLLLANSHRAMPMLRNEESSSS